MPISMTPLTRPISEPDYEILEGHSQECHHGQLTGMYWMNRSVISPVSALALTLAQALVLALVVQRSGMGVHPANFILS